MASHDTTDDQQIRDEPVIVSLADSGELSERLAQALKDEAELSKALSTLMSRKKEA